MSKEDILPFNDSNSNKPFTNDFRRVQQLAGFINGFLDRTHKRNPNTRIDGVYAGVCLYETPTERRWGVKLWLKEEPSPEKLSRLPAENSEGIRFFYSYPKKQNT
jgi:hypothetical protein